MAQIPPRHGGNVQQEAERLGCAAAELLDASASLVPFGPPQSLLRGLRRALKPGVASPLVVYPDRSYADLRRSLADHHAVPPEAVLPGNGAAELFTWAARDAAAEGVSCLPAPGFADYKRSLACWGGSWQHLPLALHGWGKAAMHLEDAFPAGLAAAVGKPLWLTNPHNPTGQLWSKASLLPLLQRHPLLIVDEAFLPLVPGGEAHSLLALAANHPRLVVIRSLTKLFAIAGLRLGYAVADPQRLERWAGWRDPWPVNGLAAAVGPALIADARWQRRVQHWLAREEPWLRERLQRFPVLRALPSAANFLLLHGEESLEPLRLELLQRHRVLLRDCRSFSGLDHHWLRLAVLDRRRNRRLLGAITAVLKSP
jgi:L-threonine-O-3-phosphate decarboxylase